MAFNVDQIKFKSLRMETFRVRRQIQESNRRLIVIQDNEGNIDKIVEAEEAEIFKLEKAIAKHKEAIKKGLYVLDPQQNIKLKSDEIAFRRTELSSLKAELSRLCKERDARQTNSSRRIFELVENESSKRMAKEIETLDRKIEDIQKWIDNPAETYAKYQEEVKLRKEFIERLQNTKKAISDYNMQYMEKAIPDYNVRPILIGAIEKAELKRRESRLKSLEVRLAEATGNLNGQVEHQDTVAEDEHIFEVLPLSTREHPKEIHNPEMKSVAHKNDDSVKKSTLDSRQRKVIFIGLLVMAAMLIFPPWKAISGRSIGYHLFFRSHPSGVGTAYLDWSRLGLQSLIVGVLIAAISLIWRDEKS